MIKWFNNLKMSVKLISLFIFLAIFMGVVGFLGIYNMNKINSSGNSMYSYNLKSVEKLATIKENFSNMRADLVTLAYDEQINVSERDELINEVNTLSKENSDLLENYKNTLLSPKEEIIFGKVVDDFNQYSKMGQRLSQFVVAGDYSSAVNEIVQGAQIRKDLYNGFNEIIKMNVDEADTTAQNNTIAYKG